MKKILRTLAVAVIAVAAVLACTFAVACSEPHAEKSDYNFTIVYADGTAVNGKTDGLNEMYDYQVTTQICLPASEGGKCVTLFTAGLFPNQYGELNLSQAKVDELFGKTATKFAFHAIGVKDCKHDCEIEVDGPGDYTLKLTAAQA